jgi:cell division septation protein DedD
MDWLRRNWVDVLMAGLILAVVGGFLTLLLRGGVIKPNAETNPALNTNPTTSTVTTVPAPTTPTPAPTTPTPAPTTPTPPSSTQPATGNKPTPTPETIKPRTTVSLGVPDIPEGPISAATTSNSSTTTAIKPSITKANAATNLNPTSPTTKPQASKVPTTTTSKPNTTSPKTTGTYTRADFLRNYRVAAGSYINLERAKKAVTQLRARGLPAQTFPSATTHVVVVGPYARETSARTAFAKVRQLFPDAILYRPDGTKESYARVNPAPKTPTPQGGSTGAPATFSLDTAYLQVGAFKDSKGATALLNKLKNAGFKPLTKSISGLLRVLVGPLQTNQIQTIRSELKNQGFEAFQINL